LPEIAITRVYDAPREQLWAAWTQPERLAQWWGKRGWNTSFVEMDVRPGGIFRLTSVSDADGAEMSSHWVYREVVEPERLVFGAPGEADEAVVTFAELAGGRTEMRFRTTISQAMRERAAGGLASAFDRLAEHLQGALRR
jgi:uncharacterized protein YndB with AHSA1/START domain